VSIEKPLTQQEVFESLVKEWLEPEKPYSETIYNKKTLHFAKLVKSFLMTIDHQADKEAVLNATRLALKEMYGPDIQINLVKTKK